MVEKIMREPLIDAPTTSDVVAAAYAIAHMEPVIAQHTAKALEQTNGMTQAGIDVLHISARISQENASSNKLK